MQRSRLTALLAVVPAFALACTSLDMPLRDQTQPVLSEAPRVPEVRGNDLAPQPDVASAEPAAESSSQAQPPMASQITPPVVASVEPAALESVTPERDPLESTTPAPDPLESAKPEPDPLESATPEPAPPETATPEFERESAIPDPGTGERGTAEPAAPQPAIGESDAQLESAEGSPSTGQAESIDLWERMRRGFAMPELGGPRVRSQERWYASRPAYVQRMTERAARYLFHVVEEVERRGLPGELALLPFIESAFNPEAMSRARASGMWQFIASTGRNFDLTQNVFRDERRDVLASTRAALDYLEMLHGMFGDWHLALAAYNWGEGNVARAVARNRRAGKPTGYPHLRMPNETRHYVPKLQAVKNIVSRPAEFGLALPEVANRPYFVSVAIDSDIDVELAAQLAGMSADEFRALNPQMNKPVILAAGTPHVLLPHDNATRFEQQLSRHDGSLATLTAWVAPKTLKPADAAARVGVSEARLRHLNKIPPRTLIRAGSTLVVPRPESHETDVPEHLADSASMVLVPDGSRRSRATHPTTRRDGIVRKRRRR